LEIAIDSIAKYAGCRFKQPEIPEGQKNKLKYLSDNIPDPESWSRDDKERKTYEVRGMFYDDGSDKPKAYTSNRRDNERFLDDIYRHYDVFALLMPSYERFAELYQCTLVPIHEAATPAIAEPTAPAQQVTETPAESVSAESVPV
jgi:hypothetical protein